MNTLTITSIPIFTSLKSRTSLPIPSKLKLMANFVPPKATLSNDKDHVLDRRELLIGAGALCGSMGASSQSYAAGDYPIKLEGVVSRVVARPRKSRSKKEKEDVEEVLVIGGIEFDRTIPVKFDVYVNDKDAVAGGPVRPEFAGSLVNVPHSQGKGKTKIMRTSLRLGITDLLEAVGADEDESVLVTLVPKSGKGLITIGNIGIQLLA